MRMSLIAPMLVMGLALLGLPPAHADIVWLFAPTSAGGVDIYNNGIGGGNANIGVYVSNTVTIVAIGFDHSPASFVPAFDLGGRSSTPTSGRPSPTRSLPLPRPVNAIPMCSANRC